MSYPKIYKGGRISALPDLSSVFFRRRIDFDHLREPLETPPTSSPGHSENDRFLSLVGHLALSKCLV